MTNTTPRTGAPLLAAAQAQKHITHNDALLQFDCLFGARILARTLTAPPPAFADGDCYLIASPASGAWKGQDGKLAYAVDGGWRFYPPFQGLLLYVVAEATMVVFNGNAWADWSSMLSLQNLPTVGINTSADPTNKLAIKSSALLFDHIGNGMQAKINKNGMGDTASLLYQTGYCGHAEIGLCGDNNFHFKVSPNGSNWVDALQINANNGLLSHVDGTIPRTLAVLNSGDINDSSIGSGSFYVHSLTYTLPANFLAAGRAIRVSVAYRMTSGSTPPGFRHQCRANNTVIWQINVGSVTANLTNVQNGTQGIIQATTPPSGSASVECSPVANTNAYSSAVASSAISMPVTLSTNVPITISTATMWDTAGTGTSQCKQSQLIIEALN